MEDLNDNNNKKSWSIVVVCEWNEKFVNGIFQSTFSIWVTDIQNTFVQYLHTGAYQFRKLERDNKPSCQRPTEDNNSAY